MLQLDDGPHGDGERVTAHLHGLDEALGGIDLLLDIEQCLLRLAAHVLLVLLILLHRVGKRLRHLQLGYLTIVEGEGDGAVVLGVDDEVGRDLLQTPAHRLTHGGPWSRIQLTELTEEGCCLFVVQTERRLDLLPVLLRESLEVVVHHTLHQVLQARGVATLYLEQQTLLEVARTDAGRVELLQDGEHLGNLVLCDIEVMIDGQFVADGVELLAEQSVVVERADQIFQDIALTVRHVHLAHLFLQLVVERDAIPVDHLLALLGDGATRLIDGQILIVAPDGTEGLVEGRLSLLALVARLEVLLRGTQGVLTVLIVHIVSVILLTRACHLEGRIVVHLGIDTVYQLHHWQFHQ